MKNGAQSREKEVLAKIIPNNLIESATKLSNQHELVNTILPSNPLPPLASQNHGPYDNNGAAIAKSGRTRTHSNESNEIRPPSEVADQHLLHAHQYSQFSTPSSTPHATPLGTPSTRKKAGSGISRKFLRPTTDVNHKEEQYKLDPVKQVLFPIGCIADSSEQTMEKTKMPALVSLTTSPTYTALSLNAPSNLSSSSSNAIISTTTMTSLSPATHRKNSSEGANLAPLAPSSSSASSTAIPGIAALDNQPALTASNLKGKYGKNNDSSVGTKLAPQILPIPTNSNNNNNNNSLSNNGHYSSSKLTAVSAMSSSIAASYPFSSANPNPNLSLTPTSSSYPNSNVAPSHSEAQSNVLSLSAPLSSFGQVDTISHSKRLARVLKSATAWAEENLTPPSPDPVHDHTPASGQGPGAEMTKLDDHHHTPSRSRSPSSIAIIAEKNDRIVQERLQEAKSLSRRNETQSGSVMHSFSLWSKKKSSTGSGLGEGCSSALSSTAPAAINMSLALNQNDHSGNTWNSNRFSAAKYSGSSDLTVDDLTSPRVAETSSRPLTRLRGPKAARELLQTISHEWTTPSLESAALSSTEQSLKAPERSVHPSNRGLPNLLRNKVDDLKQSALDDKGKDKDKEVGNGSFQNGGRAHGSFTSRYRMIPHSQGDHSPGAEQVSGQGPTEQALSRTFPVAGKKNGVNVTPILYKGSLAFGAVPSSEWKGDPERGGDGSAGGGGEIRRVARDSDSVADEGEGDAEFNEFGEDDDDDILSEMSDAESYHPRNKQHYTVEGDNAVDDGFCFDPNPANSSGFKNAILTQQTVNNVQNKSKRDVPGDFYNVNNTQGEEACVSTTDNAIQWIKSLVIGEGTFGKVFLGRNVVSGEPLAVKQLYLVDGSEQEVESIRKEIKVMWNLNHKNIVRYLGTSTTDRYLFILLEYVAGGSLSSLLKNGPLSEKLIQRYGLDIVSGVAYLHSMNIIHRDIKCANILISLPCKHSEPVQHCEFCHMPGVAKLADFGCSKQLADVCTASLEESLLAIRGSVPWMAPEVIKQSGHGRPSDIWSLGATFMEMATGKPPWPEFTNNLAALFHVATCKIPPPIPDFVSQECKQIMQRCLVIEPSQRCTAAELLETCSYLQCS